MQFDISYLTEVGRELATSTQGGANKIVYTHAEASSHDYSALSVADLKSLTAIEDVQQTVDYSHVTIKDKTSVALRVDFPSMSVTKPYNLYTVAFYARPDNGDEVLYAVMPSSIPDYVPAYDGYSNINDSFNMITTVSDTDNVMITVSQAGSLNEDDLDAIFASKHIATIDDIKANIPATVIDGSKPADFKEAVTLEKGAVDGAGNAIATTKDVSDGDATTLTSAKEYADTQVSGKADDSKVAHLSGANNFDTVPTVNNNQLLLASSLPSDLARTGQDTNFTGKLQKSGQDVATTDDLTIVYAGVPSLSFDGSGNYTITASKNADIAHITDYTLYYQVKGTGYFTPVALTPDKLTGTVDLSKVTTATNFESYATATNVFGESDPSSMVQWSYDPEKASSTPPSLTIANDGTYTITAPTSTPTPIVKYFLYYNVDGQSDATKLDVGTKLTGSLKELITKPDKTTIYDVQATAMNANVESGVSNSVQFTYVPIDESVYGASWNLKSSPTLTRTDAAVGLTAGINGAQNDFDNAGPWKGMHRVTDSMGNVFVRIPKFYIRKTQTGSPDNGTATWQVSLVSHGDDWYLPKGFWDFTNSKELDYIDIGAYDATGSSSKLTSVAGQAPLVNLSIADFRSAAKANGTGYQIWDIHANDMLQVLFIIEFATLNSQSIMEGIDNGTSAAKSGAADSHKGSSGTAGIGSKAMSYRGIENLYGNVWQFCDGVNFKDNQPWVCEDATKFQSNLFADPYVCTGYTATSSGSNYIKTLGFDSLRPYAQFTTDNSGSESTYYADYDYPGSGNTVLETGGRWDYGASGGLFRSGRGDSSTHADVGDGCRLLKKALS